jgi:uncharacterized membrane protein
MLRNAYLAPLLLAALAACSRAAPGPVGGPESAAIESANATAANSPTEIVPEIRELERGPAVDSTPLPRGFSRELKLLYLEQTFRHEARFLNESLKRDKGLAYQGFFLDAQDGWTQPTSNWSDDPKKRVKPLRSDRAVEAGLFNDEADFAEQKYDVIVVGDINTSDRLIRPEYWDWLQSWVEAGGGLILLSGQEHHPFHYTDVAAYTALSPIRLDVPPDYDTLVNRAVEKYFGRTAEGMGHEMLRLDQASERNNELWGAEANGKFEAGQLHGFYWYAPCGEPKEDATVLARVVNPGGKIADGAPLIVTRQHGKGRVLWLGTDDFHYWRQMVGDYYFYTFWQNAIRWAANDPGKHD